MSASRKSGFTLVELLVAISILAIVSVLGWRGLDEILRARSALDEAMSEMRNVQLLFSQLQFDSPLIQSPIAGEPRIVVGKDTFSFIRIVYPDNQPTQRQVVSYRLRDHVIWRHESAPTRDAAQLLRAWQSAKANALASASVPLLQHAESMDLRLWFDGADNWVNAAFFSAGPMMRDISGLEVSLRVRDRSETITKIFLLGGQ